MRLDHLLSKEEEVRDDVYRLVIKKITEEIRSSVKRLKDAPGGDALRGNTRTHPEHDG